MMESYKANKFLFVTSVLSILILLLGTTFSYFTVSNKSEYDAVGVDVDKMQINYVVKSGIRMLGVVLLVAFTAIVISYLSSRVAAKFGRELRNKVVSKVMSFSDKELKEFSIASLIKSCLSVLTPIIQTNISPSSTSFELIFIPFTNTSSLVSNKLLNLFIISPTISLYLILW